MWQLEVLAMLKRRGGAKGFHPLKGGGGHEMSYSVLRG